MLYISTPPKKKKKNNLSSIKSPCTHLNFRCITSNAASSRLTRARTGRSAGPTRRGDAMSSDAALAARDFFGGTLGGMTGDSTEQIGDLSHRLGWENHKR